MLWNSLTVILDPAPLVPMLLGTDARVDGEALATEPET